MDLRCNRTVSVVGNPLFCILWVLLVSGCLSNDDESLACLDVGSIDGVQIAGHTFLRGLIDQHGKQYAKSFSEDVLLARIAAEKDLSVDMQQLNTRMQIAERKMIASHGGRSAALRHLERYGLRLHDWRHITLTRHKRDLLTLEVMRKAPTHDLLQQFFERKFGPNGERRQVRYLLVSKNPANQSIVSDKEIEAAKPAYVDEIRNKLKAVAKNTVRVTPNILKQHLINAAYTHETNLSQSALSVQHREILQKLRGETWSAVVKSERGLVIFRKARQMRKGEGKIERIAIRTDDADVVRAVFKQQLAQMAKARAESLFIRLNGGESFPQLARTYSDHPISKHKGGLFEVFERTKAKLSQKATSKIHELNNPGSIVMTEDAEGFHIILLERYSKTSFDEVRGELEAELSRRVFDEKALEDFRQRLLARSTIQFMPRVHPKCIPKSDR